MVGSKSCIWYESLFLISSSPWFSNIIHNCFRACSSRLISSMSRSALGVCLPHWSQYSLFQNAISSYKLVWSCPSFQEWHQSPLLEKPVLTDTVWQVFQAPAVCLVHTSPFFLTLQKRAYMIIFSCVHFIFLASWKLLGIVTLGWVLVSSQQLINSRCLISI